jgi:glycosyltransferase involved in cell wall biosynthesis
MPVYNGERYLEAAILANLSQSYAHLELIISDNASTDQTETICRDLAASDRRIAYHRNDRNIGAAANYNRLFHLSSGEFFRWSNADDLPHVELVAETLPILQSASDVVLTYGRTGLIDEHGESLGEFDDNLDLRAERPSDRYMAFHDQVTLTNVVYGLMRASAMRRTTLLGSGKFPHADIQFMAMMSLQGKFIEIPRVLFYRRMHPTALSSQPSGQDAKSFWTASDARFVLPNWRYEFGGIEQILKAPISVVEKARLLAFSAKRLNWRRKLLIQDLRRLFS